MTKCQGIAITEALVKGAFRTPVPIKKPGYFGFLNAKTVHFANASDTVPIEAITSRTPINAWMQASRAGHVR